MGDFLPQICILERKYLDSLKFRGVAIVPHIATTAVVKMVNTQ